MATNSKLNMGQKILPPPKDLFPGSGFSIKQVQTTLPKIYSNTNHQPLFCSNSVLSDYQPASASWIR